MNQYQTGGHPQGGPYQQNPQQGGYGRQQQYPPQGQPGNVNQPPPPHGQPQQGANAQPCYNCGSTAHWAQYCPEPRRQVPAGAANAKPPINRNNQQRNDQDNQGKQRKKGGLVITRFPPPPANYTPPMSASAMGVAPYGQAPFVPTPGVTPPPYGRGYPPQQFPGPYPPAQGPQFGNGAFYGQQFGTPFPQQGPGAPPYGAGRGFPPGPYPGYPSPVTPGAPFTPPFAGPGPHQQQHSQNYRGNRGGYNNNNYGGGRHNRGNNYNRHNNRQGGYNNNNRGGNNHDGQHAPGTNQGANGKGARAMGSPPTWKPNNNGPRNPETGEKFPLPNGPAKANGKRTIDEADADAESGRHKQKKTSPQPEEKKDAETNEETQAKAEESAGDNAREDAAEATTPSKDAHDATDDANKDESVTPKTVSPDPKRETVEPRSPGRELEEMLNNTDDL